MKTCIDKITKKEYFYKEGMTIVTLFEKDKVGSIQMTRTTFRYCYDIKQEGYDTELASRLLNDYNKKMEELENVETIQLQGIGKVKAIRAKDLKVGMETIWNFGAIEIIKSLTFSKTGKTIQAIVETNGKEYNRKLLGTRLVGIN